MSTRGWLDGVMLQRRRECFNDHRFTTYEVPGPIAKVSQARAALRAKTDQKRKALWARDRRITKEVCGGKTIKEVAAAFGLAQTTVSWIIKRHAPQFNAREAAQKLRYGK